MGWFPALLVILLCLLLIACVVGPPVYGLYWLYSLPDGAITQFISELFQTVCLYLVTAVIAIATAALAITAAGLALWMVCAVVILVWGLIVMALRVVFAYFVFVYYAAAVCLGCLIVIGMFMAFLQLIVR